MELNRGDLYIVTIPTATGMEMLKTRPAVIVSTPEINVGEGIVDVAFCTSSPLRDLSSHVMIRSTSRPSTVLCEHTYAVDKSRLIQYLGHVTEEEQQRIDIALASAFGIDFDCPTHVQITNTPPTYITRADPEADALRAERDLYKRLYDELLDKIMGR